MQLRQKLNINIMVKNLSERMVLLKKTIKTGSDSFNLNEAVDRTSTFGPQLLENSKLSPAKPAF